MGYSSFCARVISGNSGATILGNKLTARSNNELELKNPKPATANNVIRGKVSHKMLTETLSNLLFSVRPVFLTSSFINTNKVFWWDILFAYCRNCDIHTLYNLPTDIYPDCTKNKLLSIFKLENKEREHLILSLINELQNFDHSKLQLLMHDMQKRFSYDSTILKKENKMLKEKIKKPQT